MGFGEYIIRGTIGRFSESRPSFARTILFEDPRDDHRFAIYLTALRSPEDIILAF
jgi:hypothetical protein